MMDIPLVTMKMTMTITCHIAKTLRPATMTMFCPHGFNSRPRLLAPWYTSQRSIPTLSG